MVLELQGRRDSAKFLDIRGVRRVCSVGVGPRAIKPKEVKNSSKRDIEGYVKDSRRSPGPRSWCKTRDYN